MELLQLKYFCDAAEKGSFSKTAAQFLVPTSNISQCIKRLEKELQTQLFTRSANRVQLNEAGVMFYRSVRRALDILEDGKRSVQNTPVKETVAISSRINRRTVMNTIEKFRKLHPNVLFVTTHTSEPDFSSSDIIISDQNISSAYIQTVAMEEDLLLAYNRQIFTFSGCPDGRELAECPFLTMSNGNSLYDITRKVGKDMGFEPHIALQSEDPFYIRKCIELGIGIGIVPEHSWRGQFADCVQLRKIGDYSRTTYIYQRPGENVYVSEFCDMLLQAFRA